jgi:hypothetical protein
LRTTVAKPGNPGTRRRPQPVGGESIKHAAACGAGRSGIDVVDQADIGARGQRRVAVGSDRLAA